MMHGSPKSASALPTMLPVSPSSVEGLLTSERRMLRAGRNHGAASRYEADDSNKCVRGNNCDKNESSVDGSVGSGNGSLSRQSKTDASEQLDVKDESGCQHERNAKEVRASTKHKHMTGPSRASASCRALLKREDWGADSMENDEQDDKASMADMRERCTGLLSVFLSRVSQSFVFRIRSIALF
jgi:hypothetical protein